MFDAVQGVGRANAGSSDLGRRAAGKIADQSVTLRSQLAPFGGDVTPPVPYPDDSWFPRNLAALAAMLDAGLPIRCVSTGAPGGYDTHDNQLDSFADDIGLTVRLARRLPGRPRGSRARRPGPDAGLLRVRAAARAERLGHGPRRGRARRS